MGGPARYFRHNAFEPELAPIKRIDERIDRANRIALINPFIKAFGQQSRLPRSAQPKSASSIFPWFQCSGASHRGFPAREKE